MALALDGERVKVGGWGPVYGDEGSAYRIGQTALRAAARAYDGLGPPTILVPAVLSALKLSDFRETVGRVYVEKMEPREIAALSRTASEAAAAGDEVAREIFIQAGEELAEAVTAAATRLNLQKSALFVSYQGSVFEACDLVRARFTEVLIQTFPAVKITPPLFEPVVGALLIGCESIGWKLDPSTLQALETPLKPLLKLKTVNCPDRLEREGADCWKPAEKHVWYLIVISTVCKAFWNESNVSRSAIFSGRVIWSLLRFLQVE